jgi:hypothetical protein
MACGSTFKKKLTNIKVGGKNATESFSELNKKNMELKTVRMASNSFYKYFRPTRLQICYSMEVGFQMEIIILCGLINS